MLSPMSRAGCRSLASCSFGSRERQRPLLQRIVNDMVVTRRITRSQGEAHADARSGAETPAVTAPGDTPNKKRKIVKATAIVTPPPRLSKAVTTGEDAISESKNVKGHTKKKTKTKLLETLHTQETLPALQAKAAKIYAHLVELYKDPPCPLDHANPFQLLCSVILSAQSTDKKVNEIVPPLYAIAPDAASMASLEVRTIEDHIRQIGLAPTKAKNISSMSKALVERHNGSVPDTFEELEQLAGVGHKTASVVLAVAFRRPTFPVDTHIYRLGLRWGLTAGTTVEQAEADLKSCWPESQWNALHLRLIYFGREHCPAQRHDPTACPLCSWAAVPPYDRAGHSPLRAGAPRKRG